MRQLILLSIILPITVFSQGRASTDMVEQGLKKYEIESGKITYEISGDAKGEEVFLFDRFGWRSLKTRTMSFELYEIESTQRQHEVTDGKIVYRIDHSDSTFRKRMDIRWSSLAKQMNPAQVSESILFSLGGTHASDSVLLGKTCQVWTYENKSLQEMWVWKGLVMKRISRLGDKNIVTTVTSVETGVAVDETLFSLPENYLLKQ